MGYEPEIKKKLLKIHRIRSIRIQYSFSSHKRCNLYCVLNNDDPYFTSQTVSFFTQGEDNFPCVR